MRWAIAGSCLIVVAIGLAILAGAPDFERLPPGGRAIPYLGIVLAWGFVAGIFGGIQGLSIVLAVVFTLVLLLRRRRTSTYAQRRGFDPVLLLGIVILALGLLTIVAQLARERLPADP